MGIMRKTAAVSLGVTLAGCAGSAASTAPAPAGAPGAATSADAAAAAEDAIRVVAQLASRLEPLDKAANAAWYEATIAGTDEAFARSEAARNAVDAVLSDAVLFAQVKALVHHAGVGDPVVKRQLNVLYRAMLAKQVQPELLRRITALQTEVERAFNTYRGTVRGEGKTDNELRQILRQGTDEEPLREAWMAQKAVGALVVKPLRELVALRNQVAKELGFRDYYALALATGEQDEAQLLALFDELDALTREPFLDLKRLVDRRLAARLGIEPEALRPWHYQDPFFQEPPDVFATNIDAVLQEQDTVALSQRFYAGMSLDVDDIIARSDLYEKKGKTPHAFCADIDREQDVRVVANIVPGLRWQGTMVHELGHGAYDLYKDLTLPWLLRSPAHALVTEGIAMMMESVVHKPRWAEAMGLVNAAQRQQMEPEARLQAAFASLLFSRWTQVMLRFEKALYGNPDQDLNALWWRLVQKYQGLRPPQRHGAADYASKIHLVVVPVYYHNYMLGELFSAQLHEVLAARTGEKPTESVYVGDGRIGELLKERVFRQGALYPWHELVQRATGEPLSPKAFARRVADVDLGPSVDEPSAG